MISAYRYYNVYFLQIFKVKRLNLRKLNQFFAQKACYTKHATLNISINTLPLKENVVIAIESTL